MLPRSAGKGSRMRRKPRQQKQKRPPRTPRRPRHLHKLVTSSPRHLLHNNLAPAATHTPLVTEPTTVPSINDRLQNIALEQDGNAASTLSSRVPHSEAPPVYTTGSRMDGSRPSSRAGSAHSIPTSALVCLTLMQTLELTPLHQLLHWNHTCLS